jgi:hypothetical protein
MTEAIMSGQSVANPLNLFYITLDSPLLMGLFAGIVTSMTAVWSTSRGGYINGGQEVGSLPGTFFFFFNKSNDLVAMLILLELRLMCNSLFTY